MSFDITLREDRDAGRGERVAGRQAAGDYKKVGLVGVIGIGLQRKPQIGGGIWLKGRRKDADDGGGCAAERDGLAENRRIAAETALPEAIADDQNARRAGTVFLRREDT